MSKREKSNVDRALDAAFGSSSEDEEHPLRAPAPQPKRTKWTNAAEAMQVRSAYGRQKITPPLRTSLENVLMGLEKDCPDTLIFKGLFDQICEHYNDEELRACENMHMLLEYVKKRHEETTWEGMNESSWNIGEFYITLEEHSRPLLTALSITAGVATPKKFEFDTYYFTKLNVEARIRYGKVQRELCPNIYEFIRKKKEEEQEMNDVCNQILNQSLGDSSDLLRDALANLALGEMNGSNRDTSPPRYNVSAQVRNEVYNAVGDQLCDSFVHSINFRSDSFLDTDSDDDDDYGGTGSYLTMIGLPSKSERLERERREQLAAAESARLASLAENERMEEDAGPFQPPPSFFTRASYSQPMDVATAACDQPATYTRSAYDPAAVTRPAYDQPSSVIIPDYAQHQATQNTVNAKVEPQDEPMDESPIVTNVKEEIEDRSRQPEESGGAVDSGVAASTRVKPEPMDEPMDETPAVPEVGVNESTPLQSTPIDLKSEKVDPPEEPIARTSEIPVRRTEESFRPPVSTITSESSSSSQQSTVKSRKTASELSAHISTRESSVQKERSSTEKVIKRTSTSHVAPERSNSENSSISIRTDSRKQNESRSSRETSKPRVESERSDSERSKKTHGDGRMQKEPPTSAKATSRAHVERERSNSERLSSSEKTHGDDRMQKEPSRNGAQEKSRDHVEQKRSGSEKSITSMRTDGRMQKEPSRSAQGKSTAPVVPERSGSVQSNSQKKLNGDSRIQKEPATSGAKQVRVTTNKQPVATTPRMKTVPNWMHPSRVDVPRSQSEQTTTSSSKETVVETAPEEEEYFPFIYEENPVDTVVIKQSPFIDKTFTEPIVSILKKSSSSSSSSTDGRKKSVYFPEFSSDLNRIRCFSYLNGGDSHHDDGSYIYRDFQLKKGIKWFDRVLKEDRRERLHTCFLDEVNKKVSTIIADTNIDVFDKVQRTEFNLLIDFPPLGHQLKRAIWEFRKNTYSPDLGKRPWLVRKYVYPVSKSLVISDWWLEHTNKPLFSDASVFIFNSAVQNSFEDMKTLILDVIVNPNLELESVVFALGGHEELSPRFATAFLATVFRLVQHFAEEKGKKVPRIIWMNSLIPEMKPTNDAMVDFQRTFGNEPHPEICRIDLYFIEIIMENKKNENSAVWHEAEHKYYLYLLYIQEKAGITACARFSRPVRYNFKDYQEKYSPGRELAKLKIF